MNEKELQEAVFLILMKNEISSFDISLETKIKLYEDLFETLGRASERKEKNQKTLINFLSTIEKFGPKEGTKKIYCEIKNDNYWENMFDIFLRIGVLNSNIIKTFLSTNKKMRESDIVVMSKVNSILNDLKMLKEKENN